MTNEPRGED